MMKVWQPTTREIKNTESWGIWSKEISEFEWHYDDIETCYILDGQAEAIDSKGNKIVFKAGDMVRFDKGLDCTWKIVKDIKKRYLFG